VEAGLRACAGGTPASPQALRHQTASAFWAALWSNGAMPPALKCIEPECDRPAAEGDERCELHQSRLGARPSRPPSAAAPAVLPVIVETALDASVAVPPARIYSNRTYWLGVLGWALGASGFFGGLALILGRQLPASLLVVSLLLLLACACLATYGAVRSANATRSTAKSALATALVLITGVPSVLGLLVAILALISLLSR